MEGSGVDASISVTPTSAPDPLAFTARVALANRTDGDVRLDRARLSVPALALEVQRDGVPVPFPPPPVPGPPGPLDVLQPGEETEIRHGRLLPGDADAGRYRVRFSYPFPAEWIDDPPGTGSGELVTVTSPWAAFELL